MSSDVSPTHKCAHKLTCTRAHTYTHIHTGESLPVWKGVGAPVIGGTISTGATLLVCA